MSADKVLKESNNIQFMPVSIIITMFDFINMVWYFKYKWRWEHYDTMSAYFQSRLLFLKSFEKIVHKMVNTRWTPFDEWMLDIILCIFY